MALLVLAAAQIAPAQAQTSAQLPPKPLRRLALIIGNGGYPDAPLDAPLDTAKVSAALSAAGFMVDPVVSDVPDQTTLTNVIRTFLNKVKRNDIVVIYYFGHGFTHGADNFLVPIQASTDIDEADVYEIFLPESAIRHEMASRQPAIALLFLDACRTVMQFRNEGAPPPLVPQAPAAPGLPGDIIISFAADYGQKAFAPERGATSFYTNGLTDLINTPGQELSQLQMFLTYKVETTSGTKQTPWFSSARKSLFYFQPSSDTDAQEREAWLAAEQEGTKEAVQQFLAYHRASAYSAYAQDWLAEENKRPRLTYTKVMPIVPELKWDPGGGGVTFPQVDKALGVPRTLKLDDEDRQKLAGGLTASRAFELASKVVVTKSTTVAGSQGAVRLPFGQQLNVSFVSDHAMQAMAKDEAETVTFIRGDKLDSSVLVGVSLAEAVIPTSKTVPTAIDTDALSRFIAPLKAANRTIGWVSIATPALLDPWRQGLFGMQARFTKYALVKMGIPESKITVVEGLSDANGVRIRVFGG